MRDDDSSEGNRIVEIKIVKWNVQFLSRHTAARRATASVAPRRVAASNPPGSATVTTTVAITPTKPIVVTQN